MSDARRILVTGAAGFIGFHVAARLAGSRPMAHALALGGLGVLFGTLGAIATWATWSHWYSLALIVVALPSGWLGGRIYLARR